MSDQPTQKRGQTAEMMRELFARTTCPLSVREIVVATGQPRNNVKTILNKWTHKGALIRTGTPGHGDVGGYTYTQGPKRLRVFRYDLTPEERAKAKCERDRQRKQQRRAGNTDAPARKPAAKAPARAARPAQPPKLARLSFATAPAAKASPRLTPPPARETVAQFLKRGGKIEKLKGFQRDHVVAPRRPVIRFSVRVY